MPATPADVARLTSDGTVLTNENLALRASNPDARDTGRGEIEMPFVNVADAQDMLDERFAILSNVSAVHEGVELRDDFGLGTAIPYTPVVPSFRVVDQEREIDTVARCRAVVYEGETDRYSVEVVQ